MGNKILLLEDDAEIAKAVSQMIVDTYPGKQVVWASDEKDAWEQVMRNTFSVLLVDIVLHKENQSDVSGIVFVERLREVNRYQFTPVIFITSLEDPKLYVYSELHCYGYIEKPFDMERIKKIVGDALCFQPPCNEDKSLFFRKNGLLLSVKVGEIVCVKSEEHFLNIYTVGKDILKIPYKTCKQFLEEADSDLFVQCSRNSIINRKYVQNIDMINRYITLINLEEKVNIGITFRKSVKELLNIEVME